MRRTLILLLLILCVHAHAQLPVVRLNIDRIATEFLPGTLQVDDATFRAEIRQRGSTALRFKKKSFALRITDENGQKLDTALLGMRSDNSWILDAMVIDRARMRNRVSTDLWNDFSRPSYIAALNPNTHNGTQGQFVELYLNNQYWGLYCLTEKIDRKQLKLKKFKDDLTRGCLYKSFQYTNMYISDPEALIYDNTSSVWNAWECDYPDADDGEPADWAPLVELIRWATQAYNTGNTDGIEQRIDIPVWIDYYLMIELLLGGDNINKNQYLYCYDIASPEGSKIGIAPWDLDHSWGRDYKMDTTLATKIITTDDNVISGLIETYVDNEAQSRRYAELRPTLFHPDNLCARFNTYFDLFRTTGADIRETQRWDGVDNFSLNFADEQAYINQWIHKRIEVLDEHYHYTDTGILSPTISSEKPTSKEIYDLAGRHITTPPAHGLYICGGKVVKK